MDTKSKKPVSKLRPLWAGFGCGVITFVSFIFGMTLFQFFLQFTLASGYWNTLDFWREGFILGCVFGSLLGALPAVVVGAIAGIASWLRNRWPIKDE